jgi:hypothetical protein
VVDAAPYEPEVVEPEPPDVVDELDEVVELLLVEDDGDAVSEVDDVPEEAAGFAPSPEDFPSPEGFLA